MNRDLGNVKKGEVISKDYASTNTITMVYGVTRKTLQEWKKRYQKNVLRWYFDKNKIYYNVEDVEMIIKVKKYKKRYTLHSDINLAKIITKKINKL